MILPRPRDATHQVGREAKRRSRGSQPPRDRLLINFFKQLPCGLIFAAAAYGLLVIAGGLS